MNVVGALFVIQGQKLLTEAWVAAVPIVLGADLVHINIVDGQELLCQVAFVHKSVPYDEASVHLALAAFQISTL